MRTKLSPGLLKVGQYYGVKRNKSASELAKNDIVITSYHVVMWDFKKQQNSVSTIYTDYRHFILVSYKNYF